MPCVETTHTALLDCCGGPQNYGSYVGFAKCFVGAAGFDDVASGTFPANPHYRRYTTVTQRLEYLVPPSYPDYWREATYSYIEPFAGYDLLAWSQTTPSLSQLPWTPSVITSGSKWGVGLTSFNVYRDLTLSKSDSQLVCGCNVDVGYPNGTFRWTVTLSGVHTIEDDLALFRQEISQYPENNYGTHDPNSYFLDPTYRYFDTRRWSTENGWVQDQPTGSVRRWRGATAALHRYLVFQDIRVPDAGGAIPWTNPPILNWGTGNMPTTNMVHTMLEVRRKLDSPFESSPRCRYTFRTVTPMSDTPVGGPLDCAEATYTSNQVVQPTYVNHPYEYVYSSGSGQSRTVIIPPDNEDGTVGTPPCCTQILAP